MLEPSARLAASWHLGFDPFRAAELALSLRSDRLVLSRGGQLFRARDFLCHEQGPIHPTDRAKRGSKRYLICDGQGVPLTLQLTRANVMTHNKLCS